MTFYGRSYFIGPSRTEVLKRGPVNLRGIINLLQIYKHPENVMFMYKCTYIFLRQSPQLSSDSQKALCWEINKSVCVVTLIIKKNPYLLDIYSYKKMADIWSKIIKVLGEGVVDGYINDKTLAIIW